eukprot:m.73023 g.73023  ORF g.73023 m.73023 type:complete len:342 (-) comp17006_c0_seq2:64-1089(-)
MAPVLLLLLLLQPAVFARQANVSNIEPRRDVHTNAILDIHDGNTMLINSTFFWFGAGYGPCQEMSSGCASSAVGSCGFNLNHTVNLATSPDLVHWTFQGAVLTVENRPSGILFSPWVAQSNATGLYVLWVNILPVVAGHGDFEASRYSVATSSSPYGPFKVVSPNVTGLAYQQLPDAASIFVDDDGKGYIAFTHETTHINHVQELTPDLLGPLPGGKVSDQIGPGNNEGILMFKRNGVYYIGYGLCCCFCGTGTNVVLYSASGSPLGPYTLRGQVVAASDWHAQTGSVWFSGVDYVLCGDRWQSAPDHLKAHDFTYCSPLVFNADGSVQPQQWQDSVVVQY